MPPIEPTPTEIENEIAKLTGRENPDATAAPVAEPAALGISKQPNLSSAEVRSSREVWIGAGLDPVAFDAAVKADGFDPTPIDPAVAKHDAEFGISETVSPSDYKPVFPGDFARSLSTERLAAVNAEASEWAASLKLPAALGTAVIEHLAEIGPLVQKMSAAEKDQWVRDQYDRGVRHTGSPEKWRETRAKAEAALVGVHPFGSALRASPAFHSVWLSMTLANHAATVEAWNKGRPK